MWVHGKMASLMGWDVGAWKNGKPHGLGAGTFPDGRELIGEFEHGKFVGK
jgi:hypothetical protein